MEREREESHIGKDGSQRKWEKLSYKNADTPKKGYIKL